MITKERQNRNYHSEQYATKEMNKPEPHPVRPLKNACFECGPVFLTGGYFSSLRYYCFLERFLSSTITTVFYNVPSTLSIAIIIIIMMMYKVHRITLYIYFPVIHQYWNEIIVE